MNTNRWVTLKCLHSTIRHHHVASHYEEIEGNYNLGLDRFTPSFLAASTAAAAAAPVVQSPLGAARGAWANFLSCSHCVPLFEWGTMYEWIQYVCFETIDTNLRAGDPEAPTEMPIHCWTHPRAWTIRWCLCSSWRKFRCAKIHCYPRTWLPPARKRTQNVGKNRLN